MSYPKKAIVEVVAWAKQNNGCTPNTAEPAMFLKTTNLLNSTDWYS